MELKINVDETMFKDVIEKELKAFSSQELHEIIRECIAAAFKSNEVLESLVFKKSLSYHGYTTKEPSELMFEAAKKFDLSPAFAEVQNNMIRLLKENYREILENVCLKTMLSGFCYSNVVQKAMEETVLDVMDRRANGNG